MSTGSRIGRWPRIAALLVACAGFAPVVAFGQAGAGASRPDVEVLKGSWVRPDGGYTIAIKSVGPNGQLQFARRP